MQKTPKKNVTMGIGFNLRLISKLVLVTILNYKIVPIEHFGILYLLQYEKSIFSNSI